MSQSQPPWDSLPVLALKSVFEHLELRDVLSAATTCQHWRSALLVYDGFSVCLKLKIPDETNKHQMLTRIFKKHLKRLQVYISPEANEETLNNFMRLIIPQFLDSIAVREVTFVGPIYMSLNKATPYAQLRRVIFETLVHKHADVLQKVAVLGCETVFVDENDRYLSTHMGHYSKPLTFYPTPSILSMSTVDFMRYSSIHHIVFDFEQTSTEILIILSGLTNLQMISLNIMSKENVCLPALDWMIVNPHFQKRLQVAVNIVALPHYRVKYVIDAFGPEMPLVSLKVMFCKVFYVTLVHHITTMYNNTLEELCWVDIPSRRDRLKRMSRLDPNRYESFNYVNPFIYLAWQCKELRKLTIHGYWLCEYDLVGITRLREDIDIDVSAVYDSRERRNPNTRMQRVAPPGYHTEYRIRLHRNSDGSIKYRTWELLPEALKQRTSPQIRAEYIANEVMNPLASA